MRHGNLKEAISEPFLLRFFFSHPNAREFRIREETETYLPAGGHSLHPEHIVADYAEVVFADVSELWATCNFSHSPYAWSSRLEAFVHFDISVLRQLHSG